MSSIAAKVAHVRERAKLTHRHHTCHARGCRKSTPPAYFMCPPHWRMVPKHLQKRIWELYNAEQEDGEAAVTAEYLKVTKEAVQAVAATEAVRAAAPPGPLFAPRGRR